MRRCVRTLPLLPAILVLAAFCRAETTAPASESTDALTEASKRTRSITDHLAASLASTKPKYNPPPQPKADGTDDESPDLREIDKPKNKIIRLPKYTVIEKKPPVLRERDLYSVKNRAEIAMQRYPWLKFGPFSDLNRPVALAMYGEQERLQNIADMKDTVRTVSVADKAGGVYIKRLAEESFMRSGSDHELENLGDAWAFIRSK